MRKPGGSLHPLFFGSVHTPQYGMYNGASFVTTNGCQAMSIKNTLKAVLPSPVIRAIQKYRARPPGERLLIEVRDLILDFQTNNLQRLHPNPLNAFGRKCFSQTDEDGITLEILRRLKCTENGTFAEFGVGDGTENLTLILKSLGWRGYWVGGQNLAFEVKQPKETFSYFREWITLENILNLANEGKKNLGAADVDVISLDLDGNDYYFVENLLSNGFAPKLFIVEYNAKFIPPVRWKIDYDPAHTWQYDDYFGASLASFVELFKQYQFRLVCCNSHTGANAFFIREDLSEAFADIPLDTESLYVAPRYYAYRSYGHKPSVRTIAKLFT